MVSSAGMVESSLPQALQYGIDKSPPAGTLLHVLPVGVFKHTTHDGVCTVNAGHSTDVMDLVPSEFYMGQNYPNPFSERTAIKFCVAYRTRVRVEVFDSEGRLVERLVDEVKEPGTYEVEFRPPANRLGQIGNPNGELFYCRFEAGDYRGETKMVALA